MWRQNTSQVFQVSDRSLSDDADELDEITYDDDCVESLQSLYPNNRKKDISVLQCGDRIHELQNDGCVLPQSLPGEECNNDSDHESISDEEHGESSNFLCNSGVSKPRSHDQYPIGSENLDAGCRWFTISNEAKELVCSHKKAFGPPISSSSEVRINHKGGRGRSKLKFSFRSHLHKEDISSHDAVKSENQKLYDGLADCVNEKNPEQKSAGCLISELLEDLPEKKSHVWEVSDLVAKKRKGQAAMKRSLPTLGSRILDNEDSPEFRVGISSEDDEDNYHDEMVDKVRGQTMADLFQEAFHTATLDECIVRTCKQAGWVHMISGYHERLQQVMQIEKDKNAELWKQLQGGWGSCQELPCERQDSTERHMSISSNKCGGAVSPDESRFMDVQILSRALEAKLTVCQCLFGENVKSSQLEKDLQSADGGPLKRTIIFSSKLCANVDLEVGNKVRIHRPWQHENSYTSTLFLMMNRKEIRVNEDEKIFLCTYFSQIMSRTGN